MASVLVIFSIFAVLLHEGVNCKPRKNFGSKSWTQAGVSDDGTSFVNVFNNGPTTTPTKPAKTHATFDPFGSTSWSQTGITDDGASFVNNFNNGPTTPTPKPGAHSVFSSSGHPWSNPTQTNDGMHYENGEGSVLTNFGNTYNFYDNNHGATITDGEDDEYEVEDDGNGDEWDEEEDEGEEGDEGEEEWEEGEEESQGYVEPIKPTKKPASKPTETPTPKEDYQTINKLKVAVLSSNVVGYQKQGNAKTIDGHSFKFTVQKYVKPGTEECFKMVTVRKDGEVKENVKISCEYEEPDKKRGLNLHFEGVIYESLPFSVIYVIKDGSCLSKNYFKYAATADKHKTLTEHECEKLTGRSKKERISGVIPGTEPISAEDFAVMKKQIVVVLKGSVKGFKPQKRSTYTTPSFRVEVQDYVKGSQCVKVVSLKKDGRDQYYDKVKLPCEVTAPVVTDDEDIELNFGNLVYVQNGVSVVYVIKDGDCLERTYYVAMDQVKYNERTLNPPECYRLTRWKQAQRRSSEKLNKQPPPKTPQAPGFMWMLSVNGNMESGLTGTPGKTHFKGGVFSLELQDFVRQDRCVRRATLKIKGVEADKFLVSCGPTKTVNMIGDQVQYGKAFLIVPGPSPNTYLARFNMREKSCVKRKYTVAKGKPVKILKSQDGRTNDKECKALVQGTVQLNGIGSNNGGSGIVINGIGNSGSGGNTIVMGDGMTISNVGPNDHVIM